MSSTEPGKLVDIGNEMCGPFLLSRPQFHLPDLEPQDCSEGGRRFQSLLGLKMRYYDQYYSIAVAAVLFYDFFLTLADEVSHFVTVLFR